MHLEIKPVMKAMSKLSSSEIRSINLSIFEGNSHTEISKKIGMPLGTVKSRKAGKINLPMKGPFYLVFDNSYSLATSKTVKAQIKALKK